jgi:hypothetical protein
MPSDLEILMGRVERLERENLRFRRLGITALILIGAALAMGQAVPARTIEAESFLLKDVDGNLRAKLDAKDGSTKLLFFDRAGHERVALTSAENSAALEMKDEKGRLGATMGAGVSKDGMSSTIAAGAPLIGPVAGPGVIMQAWEDGTSLRICNKGGHQVWEAPSGREATRK